MTSSYTSNNIYAFCFVSGLSSGFDLTMGSPEFNPDWKKIATLAVNSKVQPEWLILNVKGKGKGFPYSTPSVGPEADPGVQAVSPQVTVSHTPGGRLPLLSARPAVTSPAAEHHHPLAGTKLYCLVTEAHRYKQLAQGCYAALPRAGFEPATY